MAWGVDDLEETIAQLRERGVIFEEYDVPGLEPANGIAEVEGNYPSKEDVPAFVELESGGPSPGACRVVGHG
jgi:hypothetical protein